MVIPETGICRKNGGRNLSDPASGNCIAPGKKPRPHHHPRFLTKDGKQSAPLGSSGCIYAASGSSPGALMNTIDFHMNLRRRLTPLRWQWTSGMNVEVERAFPYAATEELIRRGQ